MEIPLLLVGVAAAVFVGFNVGGSSTGVAFGPAVGSGLLSKAGAAVLMTVFVFLGGWTVGRNVIKTVGSRIVPSAEFTLVSSVAILGFVGGAMLVANLAGVPVSTSMTAVGAVAGLGLADGTLRYAVMARIASWWLVAPVVGFWCGAVLGRHVYAPLARKVDVEPGGGPVLTLDRTGPVPLPRVDPETGRRKRVTGTLVVVIACYMAFSAGASNVANAVAPLVGSGDLHVDVAIVVAAGAIGLGGFTIAGRTIDTVGGGLTDLPLVAALLVAAVSATVTTALSWLGIPISLTLTSLMCIVGLGWGRATRTTTVDTGRWTGGTGESSGPGCNLEPSAPEDGGGTADRRRERKLYDPGVTGRVMALWVFSPAVATGTSYAFFSFVLGSG